MKTAQTNDRFGCWTIQRESERGRQYYFVICDCGYEGEVRLHDLIQGKSLMCKACATSVARADHNSKLQLIPTRLAWASMVSRSFEDVCELFVDSFAAFYLLMGDRPSPEHVVTRIDKTGQFEPGNVEWSLEYE